MRLKDWLWCVFNGVCWRHYEPIVSFMERGFECQKCIDEHGREWNRKQDLKEAHCEKLKEKYREQR